MSRLVNVVLILVMIGGAVFTYRTKHQAVETASRVAELRHRIDSERIAISLLKAEWSTANQPSRLEGLVKRYQDILHLAPFGVDRMVRIEDLPRQAPLDGAWIERLARANSTGRGH